MSGCNRIQEIISDYIEGELSRDQKKWVESHLADCKNCDEVIARVKKIRNSLANLKSIKTSPDFETILRTRIKIESGIGRRRLQELIWTWPARIPIYGMSLALIVIAVVLVIEQIRKPDNLTRPDAYINNEWYGGKSSQNIDGPVIEQTDNVIYVIDRMAPEDILQSERTLHTMNDTLNARNDSISTADKRIKQVNRMTY